MELLFVLPLVILILAFWLWILFLPVSIAERRGISGNDLSTIKVLCWLTFLFGFTWIVAFTLSLAYQPQK